MTKIKCSTHNILRKNKKESHKIIKIECFILNFHKRNKNSRIYLVLVDLMLYKVDKIFIFFYVKFCYSYKYKLTKIKGKVIRKFIWSEEVSLYIYM